ncbi:hypothetical protein [Rhodococcus xishaensis]|uniref:Uncharacterized protein n=1 Tax=Rhodococcus xishaensis TaxID=2487364 RepID=A0A438B2C8_9NOCA|nr:hypothetical protein [Rhodococcus xishaensis]RVW05120.1 hypothetical protein EGT50_00285 [Rhodococcus xishaensis]
MQSILDAGSAGLRYFALYLPRAAAVADRLGCGRFPAYCDLQARYFEQQGIDLSALDSDVETLTQVAADLDRQFDDQESMARILEQSWTGTAADRVGEHLTSHLARAEDVRRSVRDVRRALIGASEALRDAAARKAGWVADLDVSVAGTLTPDEIDRLIIESTCDDRLTSMFLPHVRDTVSRFVSLCDETQTAVDDIYRDLACTFAGIDHSAFPTPDALVAGHERSRVQTSSAFGVSQAVAPEAAEATALTRFEVPPVAGGATVPPKLLDIEDSVVRRPSVSGGSPPLDGAAVEGVVRAAGAIASAAADAALEIVGAVGEMVREVAETETSEPSKSTGESTGVGCSQHVEPESCCDCAEPTEQVEISEPAEPTAPASPEPGGGLADENPETVSGLHPDSRLEPGLPAPDRDAPATYCAPAPAPADERVGEPTVTPSAHRVLESQPAAGGGRSSGPVLAEAGSEPEGRHESALGESPVLAEAGPL